VKQLTLACSLALLVAGAALGAQAETWTVDPVHSTAQFTARHFGIVPVIGTIPIRSASATICAPMHGQTRSVDLNAQVVASGKSPRGRSIIAYSATTTVDRTQWGMSYGPMIVGNNVDISLNIEADGP